MSRPRNDSFSGAATVAPSGPGAVSEPRQGSSSASWSYAVRDLGAERVKPMARLLLYALASRANADGIAYPSIATLQEDTGLARSTVFEALDQLVSAGLIERIPTGRKTATWQLRLGGLAAPASVRQPDHPEPRDRHPEAPRDGSDGPAGGPFQSATRTMHSPPHGLSERAQSASRTGWSASRTGIVRQADSHLEEDIEDDMKGADGGAGHRAPPPAPIAPDDEQALRIRLVDPTFRGYAGTVRERLAWNSLLHDFGVDLAEADRDRLWAGLVEHWASTGKRPSAALRALGAIGLSKGVDAVLGELAAPARPQEAACG